MQETGKRSYKINKLKKKLEHLQWIKKMQVFLFFNPEYKLFFYTLMKNVNNSVE